jgi:hypothetical protein
MDWRRKSFLTGAAFTALTLAVLALIAFQVWEELPGMMPLAG